MDARRPPSGDDATWRAALRKRILDVNELRRLRLALKYPGVDSNTLFHASRIPPDVLHAEMRVGEHLLRLLFQSSVDKCSSAVQRREKRDAANRAIQKITSWPKFRMDVKKDTQEAEIEKRALTRKRAKL